MRVVPKEVQEAEAQAQEKEYRRDIETSLYDMLENQIVKELESLPPEDRERVARHLLHSVLVMQEVLNVLPNIMPEFAIIKKIPAILRSLPASSNEAKERREALITKFEQLVEASAEDTPDVDREKVEQVLQDPLYGKLLKLLAGISSETVSSDDIDAVLKNKKLVLVVLQAFHDAPTYKRVMFDQLRIFADKIRNKKREVQPDNLISLIQDSSSLPELMKEQLLKDVPNMDQADRAAWTKMLQKQNANEVDFAQEIDEITKDEEATIS